MIAERPDRWLRKLWARHQSARQLRRFQPGAGLKLIIGAGHSPALEGWLRTDWNPLWPWPAVLTGTGQKLHLDLARQFPLASGSCSKILIEHVIEHISQPLVLATLEECRRVLGNQGRLRLVTPDLQRMIDALQQPPAELESYFTAYPIPVGVSPAAHLMNHEFRSFGHQFIYDQQSLSELCRLAGFGQMELQEANTSIDDEFLQVQQRTADPLNLALSFALEATKT